MLQTYHTEFLTATILYWQHLLSDDTYKQIIVDSLEWTGNEDRCTVFAFVIMPNHIHLVWKISDHYARNEVQGAFLSFTAHEFKKYLKRTDPLKLKKHFVNGVDRTYQFWERDSRVKECWTEHFLLQKINYIHNNPLQPHWNLATSPEDYYWSSAAFYQTGKTDFRWLRHYKD